MQYNLKWTNEEHHACRVAAAEKDMTMMDFIKSTVNKATGFSSVRSGSQHQNTKYGVAEINSMTSNECHIPSNMLVSIVLPSSAVEMLQNKKAIRILKNNTIEAIPEDEVYGGAERLILFGKSKFDRPALPTLDD